MALLNYPILMAADILIYKAHVVPVGVDQEPHMEVAREVARKFNDRYGTDFPEPVTYSTKGKYIPSLTGEGKMSKTTEGSFINLTDDLETIRQKISKVPTDSGQGTKVPKEGPVHNLMTFVELFMGEEKRKEYEKQYMASGVRYSEIKEELSKAIYHELEPIQEKRKYYENNLDRVQQILDRGAQDASKIARATLNEVKKKMRFSD
jgi:tryptophanyl-tRNA synthetase